MPSVGPHQATPGGEGSRGRGGAPGDMDSRAHEANSQPNPSPLQQNAAPVFRAA